MIMKVIKIIFIAIILMCLVFHDRAFASPEEDSEVYVPYPLVFIHGLATDGSDWGTTQGELNEYYRKYDYAGIDYRPYFSFARYGSRTDVNIPDLTNCLSDAIDRAIDSFPERYTGEKKVIIINHSTGGIITRLLNDTRAYKTIFIGVPNKGFPGASAISLLDNIRNNKLPEIISKYSSFWGMVAGSRFRLYANPFFGNPVVQFTILSKLLDRLADINRKFFILGLRFHPPNGRGIKQLILPENVRYEETISGFHGIRYKTEKLFDELTPQDAFLYDPPPIPDNRRIIAGILNPSFWDWYGRAVFWFVFGYRDKLKFSIQTLGQAEIAGDGLITYYSQTGDIWGWAGENNGKVYEVRASHGDETEQWQTILQAIDDDPPEITKIEAHPADWQGWNEDKEENEKNRDKHYIVVGIKEYLLADIQITKMTLDRRDLLAEFGADGKPYEKIGKKFLEERDANFNVDSNTPYKLKPGEFCIEVEMLPGIHEFKITVENPAEETDSATQKFSRPWVGGVYFESDESESEWVGEGTTFPWSLDVHPLDEFEDNNEDGHPDGEDRIPNAGSLEFTVAADTSVANAPDRVKLTAGVYIYKYENKTREEYACGGWYEVDIVERVPSEEIYSFSSVSGNDYIATYLGIDFSGLKWDGIGHMGQGDRYPVFVKAELYDEEDIQGLMYTNWQDAGGWDDDIILGDPTFMQAPRIFSDKFKSALFEIERLRKEYINQIEALLKKKYDGVDVNKWIAKLRTNGATDEDIQILLKEREKDIYEKLDKEIIRLKEITQVSIETIWIHLMIDIQQDVNQAWIEQLDEGISLSGKTDIDMLYNNQPCPLLLRR